MKNLSHLPHSGTIFLHKQGLLVFLLLMLISPTAFAQHFAQDSSRVYRLLEMGDAQLAGKNLDSAAFYYQQAGELSRQMRYDRGILDYVSSYIRVLNRQGQYEKALQLTLEALEVSQRLDALAQARANNNVGNEYQYLGNLEAAAKHFLKALELAEAAGHQRYQQIFSNNLASVFLELRESEKGYQYARESYQLALHNQDSFGMASSLVNLANSEIQRKEYKSAIEHLMQVKALGEALNDPDYVLDAYINMADAEAEQGNTMKALGYYQQGLQLLHYNPVQDYELYIYWGLARNYYQLELYQQAKHYLEKSIAVGRSIKAMNELRQLYLLGAEINEKLRNLLGALDFRKKYEVLHDSLLNAQTHRNIHQLEIEYQTSQKEKEIAQQQLIIANSQLEIHKKTNLIYFSVVVLVALLSLILIIYMLYRNKLKANAEKLRDMQKESKIRLLMATMEGEEKERSRLARELHDGVGGILSATKMHLSVLRNELNLPGHSLRFDQTASLLDNASREVRNIAHNLSPDILLKYELEDALANFCQNVSTPSLQVDFYFLGEVTRLKNNYKLVLYRIVQELVNNIIKHAQASHALVQLSHQEGLLSISVEDNGIGFDTGKSSDGIGLSTLQSRVKDMNGQMTIKSRPNEGTSVYIEFDHAIFGEKDAGLQLTASAVSEE